MKKDEEARSDEAREDSSPIIRDMSREQESRISLMLRRELRKANRAPRSFKWAVCSILALLITLVITPVVLSLFHIWNVRTLWNDTQIERSGGRTGRCTEMSGWYARLNSSSTNDAAINDTINAVNEGAQVFLCSYEDTYYERILYGDSLLLGFEGLHIAKWKEGSLRTDFGSTIDEVNASNSERGSGSSTASKIDTWTLLSCLLSLSALRPENKYILGFGLAASFIIPSANAEDKVVDMGRDLVVDWSMNYLNDVTGPRKVLDCCNAMDFPDETIAEGSYKEDILFIRQECNERLGIWNEAQSGGRANESVVLLDKEENDTQTEEAELSDDDYLDEDDSTPAVRKHLSTTRASNNSSSESSPRSETIESTMEVETTQPESSSISPTAASDPCVKITFPSGATREVCEDEPVSKLLDEDWHRIPSNTIEQLRATLNPKTLNRLCKKRKAKDIVMRRSIASGAARLCEISKKRSKRSTDDEDHIARSDNSSDNEEALHKGGYVFEMSEISEDKKCIYEIWGEAPKIRRIRGYTGWAGHMEKTIAGNGLRHGPFIYNGETVKDADGREFHVTKHTVKQRKSTIAGDICVWETELKRPFKSRLNPRSGFCLKASRDSGDIQICMAYCDLINLPDLRIEVPGLNRNVSRDREGCTVYENCWVNNGNMKMVSSFPARAGWVKTGMVKVKILDVFGDASPTDLMESSANTATYLATSYGLLFATPGQAVTQNFLRDLTVNVYEKGSAKLMLKNGVVSTYLDSNSRGRKAEPMALRGLKFRKGDQGESELIGSDTSKVSNGTEAFLLDSCLAKHHGGSKVEATKRSECYAGVKRTDHTRKLVGLILLGLMSLASVIFLILMAATRCGFNIDLTKLYEVKLLTEMCCVEDKDPLRIQCVRKKKLSRKYHQTGIEEFKLGSAKCSRRIEEYLAEMYEYIWDNGVLQYSVVLLLLYLPVSSVVIVPISFISGVIIYVLDALVGSCFRVTQTFREMRSFRCRVTWLLHVCSVDHCLSKRAQVSNKTIIATWVSYAILLTILIPVTYAQQIPGQAINIKTNCDEEVCIGTFLAKFSLPVSNNLSITMPLERSGKTVGKIEITSLSISQSVGLTPLFSTSGWSQSGSSVLCCSTQAEGINSGDCYSYQASGEGKDCGCMGCSSVKLPLQTTRGYYHYPTYCRLWDPKGFYHGTVASDGHEFLGVGLQPKRSPSYITYRTTSTSMKGSYRVKIVVDGNELVNEVVEIDRILDTYSLDGVSGSIRAYERDTAAVSLLGEQISCLWKNGFPRTDGQPPEQCYMTETKFQNSRHVHCEGIPDEFKGCRSYTNFNIDRKHEQCKGQEPKNVPENADVSWSMLYNQMTIGAMTLKGLSECDVRFTADKMTEHSEKGCSNRKIASESECERRGELWGDIVYQMPDNDIIKLTDCNTRLLEFSLSGEANFKLTDPEITDVALSGCSAKTEGCYGKPSGFTIVVECSEPVTGMVRIEPEKGGGNACPSTAVMSSGRVEIECSITNSDSKIIIMNAGKTSQLEVSTRGTHACDTYAVPDDCVDCENSNYSPWETLSWWEVTLIIICSVLGILILKSLYHVIAPTITPQEKLPMTSQPEKVPKRKRRKKVVFRDYQD